MTEQWKTIAGFEGYEASNQGRVRSVDRIVPHRLGGTRNVKGKVLKPIVNRGYHVVKLGGPNMARGVHQAVAMAWLGPKSEGMTVNHIDGNKTNNVPVNLEYLTASENVLHAYRTGLSCNTGARNGNAKLSDQQVEEIRGSGKTAKELAIEYGVSRKHIHALKAGKQRSVLAS